MSLTKERGLSWYFQRHIVKSLWTSRTLLPAHPPLPSSPPPPRRKTLKVCFVPGTCRTPIVPQSVATWRPVEVPTCGPRAGGPCLAADDSRAGPGFCLMPEVCQEGRKDTGGREEYVLTRRILCRFCLPKDNITSGFFFFYFMILFVFSPSFFQFHLVS